jgi:hypothetical protein
MPYKSEIIVEPCNAGMSAKPGAGARSRTRDWIEVTLVFVLIIAAIWTPQGRFNAFVSLSAAACVLAIAVTGRWTSREMGLSQPIVGAGKILLAGAVLCGAIWMAGNLFRFVGPTYAIPWNRAWQYAIWALVQQFILQGIFFVRLESMAGSRRAVLWTATLYAAAHIPSPVLTVLSFFGGLLFSELFRRWRNIFPLGIIHAALGLTIAASFPDKWLHHMRVGIGYLTGQHW